jgi:hypothetical protein
LLALESDASLCFALDDSLCFAVDGLVLLALESDASLDAVATKKWSAASARRPAGASSV